MSPFHFCGHVEGGIPARCVTDDTGSCEDLCTAFQSCIAYGVSERYCVAIPSIGSCPSGWDAFMDGPIAKQSSDLIISDVAGFNCVFKGWTLHYINYFKIEVKMYKIQDVRLLIRVQLMIMFYISFVELFQRPMSIWKWHL